ncbi:N-acetylmuramoyl-L-alanine amidase [Sulfuricurvum sp. IAE1]|uniref:N-acetylmuramoyl-L-alanine amidase n=1 Tax=Sulfuricurvum sp. IAE1 TaxID=2546102 RepID=UPI001048209B|nr:N-acetylmuramoyl-L-alanine amidase [Sulfuricurvum sp. IAE1]MDD3770354.1 N-acetylmuramoyl-L-alanine amidase [Sulfuricurvum sp.]TDA69246.1 N-acetylmuramoyl-L-alanine amidase [Sulfuricurvum sp. IAE1]
MLARLFLLAFFVLASYAATADNRLESARKALESGDEVEQFRGYNEYKTIYLRAMLDKNTATAREALEGIVRGGHKLGIDVSKYEADLSKLPAAVTTRPSAVKTAEPVQKLFDKSAETNIPSVIYDKTLKPAAIAGKFTTPEPVRLKVEPPVRPESVSVVMRHRLEDARWKEKGLELLFDTPIQQSQIRMSKIIEADKQRFRYIIDIDSATLSKTQTLEHKEINRIKIAQFDAKTLRLVIEHTKAIQIKPSAQGKSVYIDLNLDAPKITPPLATTPVTQPPVVEPPLMATLPPLVSVTPKDRSKKTIVIDPGHGGKDSGAVGNGFMEKNIVLEISMQFAEKLRGMGYTVYMTRSNDTFIELKDRTKFANDKEADLFISVHANAIPKTSDPMLAQGIETYFLSPGRSERAMRVAALENSEDMNEMGQYGKLSFLSFLNTEKIIASNKLAIDLQKGMLSNLRKQFPNVRDNGVREGPFWVLVGAQMPAVLLEVGYISHPDESARIADEKYQKWMVEGLVEGVARYFANNG